MALHNALPVWAGINAGVLRFGANGKIKFYGSSFITDCTGDKVEEADRETETVLTHTFDLDAIETKRSFWGLFRDRRPEWYTPIMTLDGESSKN